MRNPATFVVGLVILAVLDHEQPQIDGPLQHVLALVGVLRRQFARGIRIQGPGAGDQEAALLVDVVFLPRLLWASFVFEQNPLRLIGRFEVRPTLHHSPQLHQAGVQRLRLCESRLSLGEQRIRRLLASRRSLWPDPAGGILCRQLPSIRRAGIEPLDHVCERLGIGNAMTKFFNGRDLRAHAHVGQHRTTEAFHFATIEVARAGDHRNAQSVSDAMP